MIYSNFDKIVKSVIKQSPFQRKKLQAYLAGRDVNFFEEAELFASSYSDYLGSTDIPMDFAVSAYLEMCRNMMQCQVEFMKTGKYTVTEHDDAFVDVYSNEKKMKSYMIGLAISQFLWPTHYEMYKFFGDAINKYGGNVKSYLEIGPGHGLFLNKALGHLKHCKDIAAVDISPISIGITKSIIEFFHKGRFPIDFRNQDVLHFSSTEKYDFITMGEVLEHVTYPEKLLFKLYSMLATNGRVFISTCVNAPAIDHIYHFKDISEIIDMVEKCGFNIESDLVLPVENLPMETIVAQKIAINYCAILRREKNATL
jgi:SAM-dependent methyltransferase